MARISEDRSTKLAELESFCAGTPARQFSITLEDGTTLFVNVLGVHLKGLDPLCFTPSNHQINRAVAALSSCEPLR